MPLWLRRVLHARLHRRFSPPSAAVFIGWSSFATAVPASAAPPKCSDLNGTVDDSQMCQIREGDPTYSLHIAYPVNYPDVQPVFDYIKQTRDGFINVAKMPDARTMSLPTGSLRDRVQLGGPAAGHAVGGVQDIPGCRRRAPADLLQVVQLGPGLSQAHHHRRPGENTAVVPGGGQPLPGDLPARAGRAGKAAGTAARDLAAVGLDPWRISENFAITNDTLIFFFSQGELLPEAAGALQVTVPRGPIDPMIA